MFIPKHQVEAEIKRFREAVRLAQRQVRKAMARFREAFSSDRAYILEAHLMMLRDRNLGRQIEDCIRDNRVNAEWAVRDTANHLLSRYAKITDDYLRERGSDVADVAHRLVKILSGAEARDLSELAENSIIVA